LALLELRQLVSGVGDSLEILVAVARTGDRSHHYDRTAVAKITAVIRQAFRPPASQSAGRDTSIPEA